MRYVPIYELKKGSILGQDIHDALGHRLFSKNCTLSETDISFMSQLGIPGVYINDEISKDITVAAQIAPQIFEEANKMITNLFGMTETEPVTGREAEIREMVTSIVEAIAKDEDVINNLVNIKTYDDYTYEHSVEVAILAGVLAARCNYDRITIERAVTAGFLHDIGKTKIDDAIINAPRRLTEEERVLMMKHPQFGYDILTMRYNFPEEVNLAVLQHHEWYNGGGYPNHKNYLDILLIARLLKCADVFDAMTTKRPYHNPYLPSEVMEYIMGRSGMEFDPYIVSVMSSEICVYPVGCEVVLSDGRHGIVRENHRGFVLRPTIKLVDEGTDLNLLNDSSTRKLTIVKVIM